MTEYLIINLIVALPALLLALWRDKKLQERSPGALGFKWGYFTGFRILFVGIILLPFLAFGAATGDLSQDEAFGFGFLITVVLLVPGVFIPLRHRWAWILYTIGSMNPVLWMINGTYIKNRWKEIKTESGVPPDSRPAVAPTPAATQPPPIKTPDRSAPSTLAEPKPVATPMPSSPPRKKRMHGCLLSFLIVLGVLVVGVPLGIYFGGKAFLEYAQESVKKSPLYMAVAAGNLQEVDRLLAEGADPNVKAMMGHSPLITATSSDRPLIVERLLKAGADPNQVDNLGWAPLHHAIKTDHANLDMIAIFARNRADVNVRDKHNRTPMHRAAQFGHLEAVKLLIRLGADPKAEDENGWTPLDRGRAHPAIVKLLEANNEIHRTQ